MVSFNISSLLHSSLIFLESKLISFLHCSYCNVDKAKVLLDKFYTAKTHAPELFLKRDVNDKRIQQSMRTMFVGIYKICRISFVHFRYQALLPTLTDEGYQVIYGKIMDVSPEKMQFNANIKAMDMNLILLQMQHGISPGHIMILDSEGLTLGHVLKVNFTTVVKVAYYIQVIRINLNST